MDLYAQVSQQASRQLTEAYSTSFSSATKLFDATTRRAIYNIYGLVRVADEVVDTYQGSDANGILNDLEAETYAAIKRGFSANIIVNAFCITAREYHITEQLIHPFFDSMRMDIHQKTFNQKDYNTYIYGSAEVVGLMCLKVFVRGDSKQYAHLQKGAAALGAAFQKVNFLRDIKDDYQTRGRYYFPHGNFEMFNEDDKKLIIADIIKDFEQAKPAIDELPLHIRPAVRLAYQYYYKLLDALQATPATQIAQRRIRVSNATKASLLIKTKVGWHEH